MFDSDRYYTPVDLAGQCINDFVSESPEICVDSACGTGNLLRAARDHYDEVDCVGLDRDRNAIEALRRREPNWTLSVGDILRPTSYSKTSVISSRNRCDLLVLNPPFSHNGKMFFNVDFDSQRLKASTAMAHLLRGIELFKPKFGALVIVPESLLYSDTDAAARSILLSKYDFQNVQDLPRSTFKGTRARATVLRLVPNENAVSESQLDRVPTGKTKLTIVRGCLPVYSAIEHRLGIPYVHSTDIQALYERPNGRGLIKTRCTAKGKVEGWLVLLPRVGLPKKGLVQTANVKGAVQLSDCVIALKTTSERKSRFIRTLIVSSWEEFVSLYRGTGARYVTISRLESWFKSRGVSVEVD